MKIYRVLELPNGSNLITIGVCTSDGTIYIKKDLPTLIQIVVLIHEVGHNIKSKISRFFFNFWGHRLMICRCMFKLWCLFMEEKDALICRKWLPRR